MKVAMITPWNVKCGIYTYSRDLTNGLLENDVETYVIRHIRFGQRAPELLENEARRVPKDADIIHIQHEYGLFNGLESRFYTELLKQGKPVVTTMHAAGQTNIDVFTAKSDAVIVHNKFCEKQYTAGKAHIIPHGCHVLEPMDKIQAKKDMQIPEHVPIVGYIGFLSPYKGIEDILHAMEPVKDAGVVIGGGWHAGPDTEYIEALRELGNKLLPGRLQWTGFVEDSRLPIVYGCMDIVVVASRFATESGALLTAMAHGKPIIARDLSPFKEKGLRTFKTVDELTALIKYYLSHNAALMNQSNRSLKYCRENSWKNVAERHIELYETLL